MKRGHIPIRTCRGCGRKAPKKELTRFVMEQGHLVQSDREHGYGVYCCPDETCRTRINKQLGKKKSLKR